MLPRSLSCRVKLLFQINELRSISILRSTSLVLLLTVHTSHILSPRFDSLDGSVQFFPIACVEISLIGSQEHTERLLLSFFIWFLR
jgi:hypothetical protein